MLFLHKCSLLFAVTNAAATLPQGNPSPIALSGTATYTTAGVDSTSLIGHAV